MNGLRKLNNGGGRGSGNPPKVGDYVKYGSHSARVDKIHQNASGETKLQLTTHRGGKLHGITANDVKKSTIADFKKAGGKVEVKIEETRSKRKDAAKSLTVYHATTEEVIDYISKHGLQKSKGNPNLDIPAGVYFSTDMESGINYGVGHAQDRFALIEFEIPGDKRKKVHKDEYDSSYLGVDDAFYFEDEIPPEWIKKIHFYEEIGYGDLWYERVSTTRKQETVRTGYAVIGIKPPT